MSKHDTIKMAKKVYQLNSLIRNVKIRIYHNILSLYNPVERQYVWDVTEPTSWVIDMLDGKERFYIKAPYSDIENIYLSIIS